MGAPPGVKSTAQTGSPPYSTHSSPDSVGSSPGRSGESIMGLLEEMITAGPIVPGSANLRYSTTEWLIFDHNDGTLSV